MNTDTQATISAIEVNKLRNITGSGMMDCKKALTEAAGNIEKAIEILRKKGQKVMNSRADRETKEGAIFAQVNTTKNEGFLIELNCETDFVAKNSDFIDLGNKITNALSGIHPKTINEIKQLKTGDKTIGDLLIELMGKIGEKIEIGFFKCLHGEQIISYIHMGAKLGVLVALKNTGGMEHTETGRNVAMQIAAMKPVAVDKNDVPSAIIQKEIEIGKEQARNEGKPENMLEKIAIGKLQKFYKESTLLNQDFVKDSSITVAQMLDSKRKGLTVSGFIRFAMGGR